MYMMGIIRLAPPSAAKQPEVLVGSLFVRLEVAPAEFFYFLCLIRSGRDPQRITEINFSKTRLSSFTSCSSALNGVSAEGCRLLGHLLA